MLPPLERRDALSELKAAPQTLTSWNKCMAKAYCKWPVIIGCVVGGLVALSLLFCLVRCMCCGVACCGDCLRCCGGGRSSKKPKYLNEPISRPSPAFGGYRAPPEPPSYEPPRFAQFDASTNKGGKIHEDSLPAMPSWETSQSRKILEERRPNEDHELGRMDPKKGQTTPMLSATSPIPGHGEDNETPNSRPVPYRLHTDYSNDSYSSPYNGAGHDQSNGSQSASPYIPPGSHRGGYAAGNSRRGNGAAADYYSNSPSFSRAPNPYSPIRSPAPVSQYAAADHHQQRAVSPYTAYSPHHQQRQHTPRQEFGTPAPLIAGKRPQDSWTVV